MSLTAERAREVLAYDPETGLLTWRVRLGSRAPAGGVAGHINKASGYVSVRLDKKLYQAHRVIWLMEHGEWPHQVDHRHRTRADNKLDELREICDALNRQNVEVARRGSCTGVQGVHVDKRTNRFVARIKRDGKDFQLGSFGTLSEARSAYLSAKAKVHPAWVPSTEAAALIRSDVDPFLNLSGQRRVRSDSRTGIVGVYPFGDKWRARHSRKHVGTFDSIEEAARAVASIRDDSNSTQVRRNCR